MSIVTSARHKYLGNGTRRRSDASLRAAAKRVDVASIIAQTSAAHATADVGFNLAGFIPIPGMGPAGAAASILAHATVFYKPMVTKIAACYMRSLDKAMEELVTETAWLGARRCGELRR